MNIPHEAVGVYHVVFTVDISTECIIYDEHRDPLERVCAGLKSSDLLEEVYSCAYVCWPPVLQGGPSDQQLSLCPAGSHHCRMEQVSAGLCTPTPRNTHPFSQTHTVHKRC